MSPGAAAGQPEPAPPRAVPPPKSGVRRVLDPSSWRGALIVMAALAALLYLIEAVDALTGHRMDHYGLRPRTLTGLVGVATSPFLHSGWWELISATGPFILIGWAVLLAGVRSCLLATGLVMLIGGLATWLVAPSGVIVGVSSVVFGWIGYLLARAIFARRILWIIVAVLVAFFFSGLFAGLLPSFGRSGSWEAHVCGFGAGVLAAWLMHPRAARKPKTAPVS